MPKPTTLPRWSETAGATQSNIVAPSSGRQDIGFLPGAPVIAEWFNWLFNTIYHWCSYLDGLTGEALTWTAAHVFSARPTFSDGILVSAPATANRPGVDATGNGTAPGVLGTAANNASSAGVQGVGVGSAPGGRFSGAASSSAAAVIAVGGSSGGAGGSFTGGGGNADGLQATNTGSGSCLVANAASSGSALVANAGSGTGYGIQATGNSTKAALRITPQASAPSSPVEGDFYTNSGDHKFYYYTGSAWVVVGSQT